MTPTTTSPFASPVMTPAQAMYMAYSRRLGFKLSDDGDPNRPVYFRRASAVALKAIEMGIGPDDDTVVATKSDEFDAVLNSQPTNVPVVLKAVKGWKAVELIAKGGFRFATAEEKLRDIAETAARADECRKIEESRPENRDRAVTRETVQTLAAVVTQQLESGRRGNKPPKSGEGDNN